MAILGWLGAFILVGAYFLLTIEKISSDSLKYKALNVVSSLFLLISSYYYKAYFAVFLNGFWILIAIFSFLRPKLSEK